MNYKGMDKDMKCRGFQYEIGGEYEEETAEVCRSGFHACEYPLDVFDYYSPATSRFFRVHAQSATQWLISPQNTPGENTS